MSEPSPLKSRQPKSGGTCRRTLLALGATAAGTLTLILRILAPFSISAVAAGRVCSVVLVAMGLFIAGRLVVHLQIDYWQYRGIPDSRWTTYHRRLLNLMMGVNGAIATCLIGLGLIFFFKPNPWLQLAMLALSTLSVVLSAHVVRELIRNDGPPRGADVMEERFLLVRWLRDLATTFEKFRIVRELDTILWEPRSVAPQLSGLILFVIACLGLATTAQAVAVIPDVEHYLSREANAGQPAGPHAVTVALWQPETPSTAEVSPTHSGPRPTYEQLCGGPLSFGPGMPRRLTRRLRVAWQRFGAVSAACATKARPIPNVSGAYFSPGYCAHEYRSLAIVTPRSPSAVLLEQPARLARKLLMAGQLTGASRRFPVGSGDAQILFGHSGAYLAIRRQITDGHGGTVRKPWSCTELVPGGEPYTVLPPGLTGLWLQLAIVGQPSWPTRLSPSEGRSRFIFRDHGGATVASGACSSPGSCELRSGARVWRTNTTQTPAVTPARVRAFSPSA